MVSELGSRVIKCDGGDNFKSSKQKLYHHIPQRLCLNIDDYGHIFHEDRVHSDIRRLNCFLPSACLSFNNNCPLNRCVGNSCPRRCFSHQFLFSGILHSLGLSVVPNASGRGILSGTYLKRICNICI